MAKQIAKEKPISTAKIWLVLILGSLTAFGPLSMDMYLPALPDVANDLQASTSLVQLSLTATLLGLGVGQLFFGPLSDIHGRRRPLLFTLFSYGVVSLLIGLTSHIMWFIVLRFFQGFTGAAGVVIARASARDMYSGKALTKFIALLALVNGAAPILAPVVGGFVLRYTEWEGIFYILASIGFIMLIAVLFLLPDTLPEEKRAKGGLFQTLKTFKGLLSDRFFMGISFTQAFMMAGMFAYIAGSPFILQNLYGVSPQEFSLFFALNGLGIIAAAQLTGRLAAKFEEINLLRAGIFYGAIGGIGLIFVVWMELSIVYMAIALFMIVSSVGVISTTSFSLAMEAQGDAAGSASAFLGLLPFIAGGIVSPLVGIAGDTSAFPMLLIIVICHLFAIVCYTFARKNQAS